MVDLENARRIFDERQSLRIARAARRAAEELDREHDRIAHAAHAAINAVERHAHALAQKKFGPGTDLAFLGKLFDQPGIQTMRPREGLPLRKTSRPVSKEGRVSFHFESRDVTRGGVIHDLLAGRLRDSWGRREFVGRGATHQKYVERDDAVEQVPHREMPKPESQAPGPSPRNPNASAHQLYIERGGAAEADNAAAEITLASWGTISEDREERLAFWRALEEVEYAPSKPRVTIDPDADPAVWMRVLNNPDLPQAIRDGVAAGKRAFTLDEDDAALLFRIFADAGFVASNKQDPQKPWPLSFKLGRGGNVQTRMIIALPHEMTPRERFLLAKAYTARFTELGIPYWAVIHAPGKTNDARNFHLHINLATRPAKKIPHPKSGKKVWDFEIAVERVYANRTRRTLRPFAQNKLREMNQRDWIGLERTRFAELANAHLAAGGYTKRLDPRRHAEMGLPPARPYLDKNSYGRERRGLATPAGLALAKNDWADDERQMKLGMLDRLGARMRADADIAWFRAWRAGQNREADRDISIRDDAKQERERIEALLKEAIPKQTERDRLWLELQAKAHLALRLASRARLKQRKDRTSDDHQAVTLARKLDAEIALARARMSALAKDVEPLVRLADEVRIVRGRVEGAAHHFHAGLSGKSGIDKKPKDGANKNMGTPPGTPGQKVTPSDQERSTRNERRRVIIAKQKAQGHER